MGHFDKNAKWHDKIYQIERTDPVIGGEGGISNQAPMELADRTEWLKQQIELQQCNSIAELRTIEPTEDKQTIFVKGYHTVSAKGGGYFIADLADNASVDNAGTVIVTAGGKRWKRIYTEVTPFDFGAKSGWVHNSESAFVALENAMQGQMVNLCGFVFTCDNDKTKNHYYNGYIASNQTGSGAKGKGFVGSYKHLYSLNDKYGTPLSELVPVFGANNTPSYYSQGTEQDPRTGDIWQCQSGDNNTNALVKYQFSLNGKNQASGHVFNNAIGHQSFGIYYEGDTRYFVSMVGSAKGNDRALYVARFTINESNWQIENLKYQRIFNSPVTGNATRCMAIDPNGTVIVITNGANLPTEQGTTYRWGCSVFNLSDLFRNDSLETPPTPINEFYLFRDVIAGTDTTKAVQDIACDGSYIYVLNGGNQTKYENTIDVYTIDGTHILRDDKNVTGLNIAENIKTAGGGMYYEPEGLFFLKNGSSHTLCMSVVSGAGKSKTIKNTHLVAMSERFQSIIRGTTNTPAQYVYADGTAFAFPRGKPIRFGEMQPNGDIWGGPIINRTYIDLQFDDTTQPQFKLGNSAHKGMLQVSSSGNLGIFDVTQNKWLIASNTDGKAFSQQDWSSNFRIIYNDTTEAKYRVTNSKRDGMLQVSSSGNLGIFDVTQNKWLIFSGADGVPKLAQSPSVNANGNEIPTASWVNQKLKFDSHQANNGWQKLPNGLILQWGRYDANTSGPYKFPIAFNQTPFVVHCNDRNTTANGKSINISTHSETTTDFGITYEGGLGAFTMIAVGR